MHIIFYVHLNCRIADVTVKCYKIWSNYQNINSLQYNAAMYNCNKLAEIMVTLSITTFVTGCSNTIIKHNLLFHEVLGMAEWKYIGSVSGVISANHWGSNISYSITSLSPCYCDV